MKLLFDLSIHKKACKPAVVWRVWRAFRCSLSLECAPAQQFGCCQWQSDARPPVVYLVYRWLLFLGLASTAVASFACQQLPRGYQGPERLNRWKWFIYFTNWGFLMLVLQSGLALLLVHRYRATRKLSLVLSVCKEEEAEAPARTPLLCRVYWVTHTVAVDLAFVITLVYWLLVHNPAIHQLNTLNILVHGGNSAAAACELAVTSHPVRPAHATFGAAAGLVYGVFSALYFLLGGRDRVGHEAIYPSLNWNHPGKALGFVGYCAVVLITAHLAAAAAAAARARLARRLCVGKLLGDRLTATP